MVQGKGRSMVKLVVYFKRRAQMEVESFQEYWRTRHAEVVCGLPGLQRYVQSHTLLAGYRKGEPAWDGIAEVWFDDTDAIRALDGTDALRAVQEDEAKFIDRSTMRTLVTDEHLIKDGALPDGCVKNIEFVHRRPDLPVDEFQRYWREVHGPLASEIPVILRYVQSHCRRGGYGNGRQPPLRRGRDHLVREHRGNARVGPGRRLRPDPCGRGQLHRPGGAPVHHHPGARRHRLSRGGAGPQAKRSKRKGASAGGILPVVSSSAASRPRTGPRVTPLWVATT